MARMGPSQMASVIDHTLLSATATAGDIARLCAEAVEFGFATVCVAPAWVPVAYDNLSGSNVGITAVVGFPLGNSLLTTKAFEAGQCVQLGASEIDMVMNVGAFLGGMEEVARREIEAVVKASEGRTVKVIIETCYLTRDQKVAACRMAEDAGAGFVKTSTGMGPSGATVEDVRLMKAAMGPGMKVKAAGGIRTAEALMAMVEAGACRIGTSSGVAIVKGLEGSSAY